MARVHSSRSIQGTFGSRLDEVEKMLSPAGQHDIGLISSGAHQKRSGSLTSDSGCGPLVQVNWYWREWSACKFVKRSPERV
mmetsp:Transcript_13898/g.31889  ORF Transcript_13898/g.31889 Transcript_13898/m.31889 type:complete len:81 (+) Transcript_13898:34-276(+)